MCSADIFLALLAVLFPPLPVWVKCGICSADSLINILLCVLGYIPGLLHAWYIIAKYPEPAYEYETIPQDREGGRVTYVYVQAPQGHHQPKIQPPQQGNMNYGTQSNGGGSRGPQPVPPQPQQGIGEGSSDQHGVPPSYADVVAGDHKVQSTE
ncbi:Fc.00g080570.m01.CDS01 [Cosmosporella sp. VM-42]